jgi:hypothetical protein
VFDKKLSEWKPVLVSNIIVLLLLLTAGLFLRFSTFGDTNLHVDDEFYFLVGQRMHSGVLPYINVWDRKPVGIFVIAYIIALFSKSMIAYQISAWVFSALTAFVIYRISAKIIGGVSHFGAIAAGVIYLFLLEAFDGGGGQTPVFYNLLIAQSAYLILSAANGLKKGTVSWRILAAMALSGLAIAIKQTCLFEAIFFGVWVLLALRSAGASVMAILRWGAILAAIGALPSLSIATVYLAIGHWPEFWHAMVLSNLTKAPLAADRVGFQAISIAVRIMPIAALSIIGVWRECRDAQTRHFLIGWFVAALTGFLSVPNFYIHYALPLMVPMSVAAALVFANKHWGRAALVSAILFYLLWHDPTDRAWARKSTASMQAMASVIQQHSHGRGLLVYDGPPYLYALTGEPFLSPLVFPHHLNHQIENNVSHLDTNAEMDRILARGPGVVVIAVKPRNFPVNIATYRKVQDYVRAKCRRVAVIDAYEQLVITPIAIFGDCGTAVAVPVKEALE